MKTNPVELVLAFMEKINAHDVPGLIALLSEDYVLVDSLGHELSGPDRLKNGWQAYFQMCPDYWVSHEDVISSGDVVVVIGSAGGTISKKGELLPANKWRIPAAWKAAVKDGKLSRWQIYADNKPVYDILARLK
jgi:ketosteroid isomerase-like protein